MAEIRKYEVNDPLSMSLGSQHAIPRGSRLLSVQMQREVPVMWWWCPTDAAPRDWPLRTFIVAGTGPPGISLPPENYVGTYQDGGFVGHVFCHETEGLS